MGNPVTLAECLALFVELYFTAGILFAIAFVTLALRKVDPAAEGSGIILIRQDETRMAATSLGTVEFTG